MELQGKRIAELVEYWYEDLEFWYPYLRLKEAGARSVDAPVVRDANLISSRGPDDLPAVCRAVIDALAHS